MKKIEVVNLDQDSMKYVKKAIGIALLILGLILIFEYLIHALKIILAIALFLVGGYLLTDNSRMKWFRFRRF